MAPQSENSADILQSINDQLNKLWCIILFNTNQQLKNSEWKNLDESQGKCIKFRKCYPERSHTLYDTIYIELLKL